MSFELQIALRYLTAWRKQAFISIISAISVLGVGVGVMALMIVLGLMTGLQGEIRSRILGATAHVSLFRRGGEPFENYREVLAKVRTLPNVEGAAPALYGKGLLASGVASAFVTLKGVVPAEEKGVTELARQVEGGSLELLDAEPQGGVTPVLLGRDLAASLGVTTGDVVSATSPRGRLTPLGILPRTFKLRVVGTVKSGLYEFDSSWAYLSLQAAQRHFGEGDEVSLVELRVDDMYAARRISDAVLRELGDDYSASDWIQMNSSLFSALWLEKAAIGLAIGLIVFVAALNIGATLILMVMKKRHDIAILVSMGTSPFSILRVFLNQGAIIGAIGTTGGGLLGWITCLLADRYRWLRLPADVYQVAHVPFKLLPQDAGIVVLGAMLVCVSAALLPALGAALLRPAEALRYD